MPLSEQDIAGLITGSKQAYDNVLSLAKKFTLAQRVQRVLSREDARDILQEALLAAIHAVQNGNATTPDDVSTAIRKAVIHQAQEFHRHNTNEAYTLTEGPNLIFRGFGTFLPKDLEQPIRILYKACQETRRRRSGTYRFTNCRCRANPLPHSTSRDAV